MTLRARRTAVAVLFACGLATWFVIGPGRGLGAVRWTLLCVAVAIGAIPAVSRRICAVLDRIRHPSPRAIERTALLVGVLATAYFVFTAFQQDRDAKPCPPYCAE